MRKKGLKAHIEERTIKVLLLGSFPGEESLRRQQYYGNERNQFWEIIFKVLGREYSKKYGEKIKILKEEGIGLWDVIESCERKGSLDMEIRNPKLNNLEKINKYPDLKAIFFNGRTAENIFKKHYDILDVDVEYLPSTSPLNTQYIKNKIKKWMIIKDFT